MILSRPLRLFAVFLLLFIQWPVPAARAQAGIAVAGNEARADFPRRITFSVEATGSAEIVRAALLYQTGARSCVDQVTRREVETKPGTHVVASYAWIPAIGSLPPGEVVTWQWELRDAAGGVLLTEPQSITWEDERYSWLQKTEAGVTVMWTQGDASFGDQILAEARAALKRLAQETGLTNPDGVRLLVYPNQQAMISALGASVSWADGIALPPYGVVLLEIAAQPYQAGRASRLVAHEISHLVFNQRIQNCAGSEAPKWLHEGLAVIAEGPANQADYDPGLVKSALQRGQLPALATLEKFFPGSFDQARLAYTQSWMAATYLARSESGGTVKLQRALDLLRDGLLFDDALRQVYGLDSYGLDQAWRASLLPGTAAAPRPASAAQATGVPSPIPTLPLSTVAVHPSPTPTPTLTPTPRPTFTPTPTALPSPTPTLSPVAQLAQEPFLPVGLACLGLGVAAIVVLLLRRRGTHEAHKIENSGIDETPEKTK